MFSLCEKKIRKSTNICMEYKKISCFRYNCLKKRWNIFSRILSKFATSYNYKSYFAVIKYTRHALYGEFVILLFQIACGINTYWFIYT
jgi:hypothetical protein